MNAQRQFRSDLAQFLEDALIDAAIDADRPLEIPPRAGPAYAAFADMSGGRHDASCLCICHAEGDGDAHRYVADVVRGHRAPHDPATVVKDFADLCGQYRVTRVVGDNYSAEWVASAFRDAGVDYQRSELARSELYLEGLPLFVRGQVRIPDHPILCRELRLLERRTTRAGRDSVDHGSGGSDDHSNALFGALHQLAAQSPADMWVAYQGELAKRAHALQKAPEAKPNNRPWRVGDTAEQARQEADDLTAIYLKARLGIEQHNVSSCATCGAELKGTRVTTGTEAWCSLTCHLAWPTAQKNQQPIAATTRH